MKTKTSLTKFLTETGQWVILIAAVLVLICTAAGNVLIARYQNTLLEAANGVLVSRLSVTGISYQFPNSLVVEETILKSPNSQARPLEISRLSLRFSIQELLTRRTLRIKEVKVEGGEIFEDGLRQFIRDDYEAAVRFLESLPGGHVRLDFARLRLHTRHFPTQFVTLTFSGSMEGGIIEGHGRLVPRKPSLPEVIKHGGIGRFQVWQPVQFAIRGRMHPNGMTLQRLAVRGERFRAEVYVEFAERILQVSGFALMDPPTTPEYVLSQGFWKWVFSLFGGRSDVARVDLPENGFYVLDLDGRFVLQPGGAQVEELKFTVNNFPVSMTGEVNWEDSPAADLALTVRPSGTMKIHWPKLDHLQADVQMQWKDSVLSADGEAGLHFKASPVPSHAPEKMVASFQGLTALMPSLSQCDLSLKEARVLFLTNGNEHRFRVNNLSAAVQQRNEWITMVTMSAPFYSGVLKGKLWWDRSEAPARIISQFELADVDANKLDGLLVHFAKVQGRLSGALRFSTHPQFSLTGEINLREGSLQNYAFFNWLAGSFDLPSMKNVSFKRAKMEFLVNAREVGLKSIRLNGASLDMTGFYTVDSNGMVSSVLGLNFHRELLNESRKFRPLLRSFEKDEALNFGFQLSGNQHALNFQWLPSDVKEKIQQRIPDFIERKIERRIDESLEPAPQAEVPPVEISPSLGQ